MWRFVFLNCSVCIKVEIKWAKFQIFYFWKLFWNSITPRNKTYWLLDTNFATLNLCIKCPNNNNFQIWLLTTNFQHNISDIFWKLYTVMQKKKKKISQKGTISPNSGSKSLLIRVHFENFLGNCQAKTAPKEQKLLYLQLDQILWINFIHHVFF